MNNSQGCDPVKYCVIDDVLSKKDVKAASETWPSSNWPGWFQYDSPLEKKRSCSNWLKMPRPVADLLASLACVFPYWLEMKNVMHDASLYGAGMHDMEAGDLLSLHLDADRHPVIGLERRANVILFLNDWQPGWNGELELWDTNRRNPVVKILPKTNRIVMFETSDVSYHGVTKPLLCPVGEQRKSLAVYWWGVPRGDSKRRRALFVPQADEPFNQAKDRLRKERAE